MKAEDSVAGAAAENFQRKVSGGVGLPIIQGRSARKELCGIHNGILISGSWNCTVGRVDNSASLIPYLEYYVRMPTVVHSRPC